MAAEQQPTADHVRAEGLPEGSADRERPEDRGAGDGEPHEEAVHCAMNAGPAAAGKGHDAGGENEGEKLGDGFEGGHRFRGLTYAHSGA